MKKKLNLLTKASSQVGYVPSIIEKDGTKQVIFSIYNCPFMDQLPENAQLICACHESYLKGQIDVLFPNNDFIQFNSMVNNCKNCQYEINIKDSH